MTTKSTTSQTTNWPTCEPRKSFRLTLDPLWGRAQATQALLNRRRLLEASQHSQEQQQQVEQLRDRASEATADTYAWVTQYTQTYNEHWVEEGRPGPYENFPPEAEYPHIPILFEVLDAERITFIEKSRDLMISWACVAYLTLQAMRVPERGVLFQTQKEDKVKQLIKYAKCLYDRQPDWLKEAYPLSKSLRMQPELELRFAHGGNVVGIPGGADQVRSFHPWGYLLDEASFVVEAGDCFNEALSAVKGKIILNSSAGPGWFADVRHDIIRPEED